MNIGKTKVVKCEHRSGQEYNSGKYPCGVCKKGVGRNSVLCTTCKKWIHNKCCGMKGTLKDNFDFICSKCVGVWAESTMMKKEVALGQDGKFETVERFCYLGDMIGSGGGAEEALQNKSKMRLE